MNGSELQPRKVELMYVHSKQSDYYQEYFTHNNEAFIYSYKIHPYSSDIH